MMHLPTPPPFRQDATSTLSTAVRRLLREERKRQGLSIDCLAQKLCIDKRALERLERGETRLDLDMLERIAREGLQTTIQQLLPQVELLEAARRRHEAPGALNTVVSVADALAFFRSMYQEHIAHLTARIAELLHDTHAQRHIITALTGELEMLRQELQLLRVA